MTDKPLVEAKQLTKLYPRRRNRLSWRRVDMLRAVDRVDLAIAAGETLGLVGESGCGKSTLGRLLLRLIEPTSGAINFDGIDLLKLSARGLRAYRRHMQIVFQDPYGSLDPYKTIGAAIEEPLRVFRMGDALARRARVGQLLDQVGLQAEHAVRYPHEFSGGQRQRISIARALALNPAFVVCDEPVSSLDLSVQAQIINLFKELQERLGISYLFVSHDLRVVRHIADQVAVMYLGRIVEIGGRDEIYSSPSHPYTQTLLAAIPSINPEDRRQDAALEDEVRTDASPLAGCRFSPRCPAAHAICHAIEPELIAVAPNHKVACHLFASGRNAGLKSEPEITAGLLNS